MSSERARWELEVPDRVAAALPSDALAILRTLCHAAAETGSSVYLVGGVVRDLILREGAGPESVIDVDLAVDGEVAPILRATSADVVEHDRFGTATLTTGSIRIDLARTRRDRYGTPVVLPAVSAAGIEEDLARRDFTVNAAAWGLVGERAGELLDPHGAARDIRNGRIRVLHDRSFADDPTRLIRACRYAARLGCQIDRRTVKLANEQRMHLAALSADRFGDAWRSLLHDPAAADAIATARRLGLPEARLGGWTIAPSVSRIIAAGSATPPDLLFWASVGLTSADRMLLERLPAAASLRAAETRILRQGAELARLKRVLANARKASTVAAALARIDAAALDAACALWPGPAVDLIRSVAARRGDVRSPLDGNELIALGVRSGPQVGRWLRRLEDAVWDGELPAEPYAARSAAALWVRSGSRRAAAGGSA